MNRKPKPKPAARPTSPPPVPTPSKLRLFRFLAALGFPILVLVAAEIVLRIFGGAYPTHFFVPSPTGAPGLLAENQKFGWRFFPRRLAREPDPIRLLKDKPPDTRRIFVFGESAALGDPEPAYGFSRILREILEARCPGTHFEVVNTSMTAINSHAILSIARDCVPLHGDIWIVYMGNNEVVGPFGAGSVFGAKAPPLSVIRAGLALRRSAIGQALDALWQRAPIHSTAPARWEGMKMMLNERVRADDPVLRRVYRHFSRNLEDILNAADDAGAKPIVCSVSSNLKDCAPFASLNRADLSAGDKTQWQALLSSGSQLEALKDFGPALAAYRQATQLDGSSAELAFRTARCHLALGQADAAREQFIRARDLDALRFRCDTQINRLIREVCAGRAARGVTFFDSELTLTNACLEGIPGEECFWDHVHLNFRGNYLLARGLAARVIALLPQLGLRASQEQPASLSETECAERLAYTPWDQRSVLAEMLRRVQDPPFNTQLDHQTRIQRWSEQLTHLDQQLAQGDLARGLPVYRTSIARHPDDWILHNRFGFLLERTGDFPAAAEQWQGVLAVVPESVEACYKLGEVSAQLGKPLDAELYYRRVLAMRPTSFEAMNSLGLLFMDRGDVDQAIRFFQQALKLNPDFEQAHINWGVLETRRGRSAEAEAHYREALRCDPHSAAAHVNLGNLLAAQQKHNAAIEQYLAALTVRPDQPTVHLALANSLAAVGRDPEAIVQYQEAIRTGPTLAEAHFNLGLLLAKQRQFSGATSEFQEACRLNPQDAQAHLNLGVALARQNRLGEAITEFESVLRLDPSNAPARQYLQIARARQQ